ncbi:hypothetical protein KR222_000448 [Zaprionus bogoriensis]|nr:hypothetical protein KR222_000448 [Zaprionus bogoriensis]
MSLQDESFPADEIFDRLNNTVASNSRSLQRQFGTCSDGEELESSAPFLDSDSEKTDATKMEEHEESKKGELQRDCDACYQLPLQLSELSSNVGSIQSEHGDGDGHLHPHAHPRSHSNLQLSSGRSSKAVSYQDIHSAYTKRRYKHVTSKVSKYIADMQRQEEKHRKSSGSFQRHRSMPECLTPRSNVEDQQKLDESLANSSGTETNLRDESYERLANEKISMQLYIDYLQDRLSKQTEANIQLKKNFELVRNELTDRKDREKRQSGAEGQPKSTSLPYCPPLRNGGTSTVARATQTDLSLAAGHVSNISDLSDIPGIKPHSLNFSSDEAMIYFDKNSNRVVELPGGNRNVPIDISNSTNNQSYSRTELRARTRIGRQKQPLTSRMLRLFGPCVRCDDPNQTMDDSKATYTVGVPLLADESTRSRVIR